MSFLTYKDVRPWAKAMKTAVVTRQMPPWFADPAYGHFANDKRLSDAEIETISAWADSGALEGDAKDKPAPVAFHDGWNLKPDMIIEMPKDFNVPATGTMNYKNILVKVNFPEDMWVVAAEMRPGNRQVLHHGRVLVRPPASEFMKDAVPGEAYETTSVGMQEKRLRRRWANSIQDWARRISTVRIGEVRAEGIGHRLQSALHLDRQSDDRSIPGGSGLREKATQTALLHA